ncbi:MAG TPA: hypothetical protein VD788_15480 [Candidatus Polarisedimenticolaceae bacterium]|nr:hypothetical protein [Candidatus Polarisedimenticolaceae bacterium]
MAIAVLASAATVMTTRSAGAEAQWMWRDVHEYRVALAVESVHDPAADDPRHAPAFDHRFTVIVSASGDRAPVEVESVSLDVAVRSYSGTVLPLARASGEGKSVFEGNVRMARGQTYRILVHFRPAGSPMTREAQYEYRHHH